MDNQEYTSSSYPDLTGINWTFGKVLVRLSLIDMSQKQTTRQWFSPLTSAGVAERAEISSSFGQRPKSQAPADVSLEVLEDKIGLFDNITANVNAIAGKVGMTPDQVTALTCTLQSKMTELGGDKLAAIQAAASQHDMGSRSTRSRKY